MLQPHDRVVVGVSGGADSVCLLFLLAEYRKKTPLELAVVHVHHGIREDADADADFVRDLCEKLKLPFCLEKLDVRALAAKEGVSEEEAGRKARYEAFERYAADHHARKIALAHHMGDRAETLLFHLFRGTGSRGLASIQPVREHRVREAAEDCDAGCDMPAMTVIRPLLCLERTEIEEYLRAIDAGFCQDSTNGEDAYARNRIRHHILPYAEEQICEGAVRHINQAAAQLSETEEYLAFQTAQAQKACAEGDKIHLPVFLEQHPVIQKRILMELLLERSPHRRDVGSVHVQALLELCRGGTGRSLHLPMGVRAKKTYDCVILEREGQKVQKTAHSQVFLPAELPEGEVYESVFGTYVFHFQILKNNKFLKIPENQYTKWFDYDKIKGALSIRSRETGDYLTIRGREGECVRKKVKDYMINEKIPRETRESLALLADGDHILWIPGYRISEAYKIDDSTERILEVELLKDGG